MEYPIFDIPYKEAYVSLIEFKTQINEMMKGFEQRYPVWTYPKRVFTLKFDKNKKGRKLIEDFFVKVMGQAGKFQFVWEKDKGGNGNTYICSFDSDTLKQSLKDFGYSEFELSLVCIDNHPIQEVQELDFCYKADCEISTSFYTLIDKVFTARNERKSYWDAPKKSWTLSFEKNAETRKKLEDFFISKRGRFRAFEWVWKEEFGGDGKTYTVRFDNDSLESQIDIFGYGKLQMTLKEVFPSHNPLAEPEKDEIIPRKLLKIEIDGGSVYIIDNETLDTLDFNGETFIGAPLELEEIKKDDTSTASKLSISLSNVGLSFSGIIGQRGDVITDAPAVLTLVFLNVNTNTIIPNVKQVLYAGRCNNLKLDYETAKMDIEPTLGGYEIQAPILKYRSTCQVRRFKDCRCRYKGEEESCDRTFTRCKELGNEENFYGFPQMYNELVIKA